MNDIEIVPLKTAIKTLIKENDVFDFQCSLTETLKKLFNNKLKKLNENYEPELNNNSDFFKAINDYKNNKTYQQNSYVYSKLTNNQIPNITDILIDIITNARFFGSKDSGEIVKDKLILKFLYPKQCEHFIQWLNTYNPELDTFIQKGFDISIGDVVIVVIYFPDIIEGQYNV